MQPLKPLNQAMQYIEENLTQPIDFQHLSRIACCSEYQFRRLFSFLSGMSLGEYIRLRRLSEAAGELAGKGGRVLDVALRYGYDSPDAFARAFQALHGISPKEAKQRGAALKRIAPMTFRLTIEGGREMKYRIVTQDGFRIVGLYKRVALQYHGVNAEIAAMWQSLTLENVRELKALAEGQPSGFVSASLNFAEGRQEGTQLDQYIGVVTRKPCPAHWQALEVAAGSWAVFTARGAFPQTLQNLWARIYTEWLPGADYEVIPGPEILWNESPDTSDPNYHSEIWIPVVQKNATGTP